MIQHLTIISHMLELCSMYKKQSFMRTIASHTLKIIFLLIKNIVTHKGSYFGHFDLPGHPSMLVRQKLHTTGVANFELSRRNH